MNLNLTVTKTLKGNHYRKTLTELGDLQSVIKELQCRSEYELCNELLVKSFSRNSVIKYLLFISNIVIGVFEKENPGDDRPQKATIAIIKSYDSNDCFRAANAAAKSAHDTDMSPEAMHAAYCIAYCAYAASVISDPNHNVLYAKSIASVFSLALRTTSARVRMCKTIIKYGLSLIAQEDKVNENACECIDSLNKKTHVKGIKK